MAKLFPPGYQFLDSNGDPVASGTVNFYQNGTTTDQNIYTDPELATAATNPATLDSAGRFSQGDLYGEGTYTVVLKDSGSTQIWSRDDHNPDEIFQGDDIASATALDVNVPGIFHDVTGTTTITSFATVRVGAIKILQFDGVLTLTHNATDLILPGGQNIITTAGDIGVFYEYASGDWRCVVYSSKFQIKSITDSITAGTTQTQAGATALTTDINRVTTVAVNGDGVKLPTASTGKEILIINDDSAQNIQIWPNTSDSIDGGAADAVDSNTLAAGASRRYVAVDGTNWYTA